MTQEQKAAFIYAQAAMLKVELILLQAQIVVLKQDGFDPEAEVLAIEDLKTRWEPVLGYNAMIEFFNNEL